MLYQQSLSSYYVITWKVLLAFRHYLGVVHAHNKMHVRYKVWVEWGIGGLKQKWKRLMKCFDSTKEKYNYLLQEVTIFTHFLNRHHLNFTYEIIGNQIKDPTHFDRDEDF